MTPKIQEILKYTLSFPRTQRHLVINSLMSKMVRDETITEEERKKGMALFRELSKTPALRHKAPNGGE